MQPTPFQIAAVPCPGGAGGTVAKIVFSLPNSQVTFQEANCSDGLQVPPPAPSSIGESEQKEPFVTVPLFVPNKSPMTLPVL